MTTLFILSSEVIATLELWVLMVDVVIILLTALIVMLLHRILISTKQVRITKATQKASLGITVILAIVLSSSAAIAVFSFEFSSDDPMTQVVFSATVAVINFIIQVCVAVNSDAIYKFIRNFPYTNR